MGGRNNNTPIYIDKCAYLGYNNHVLTILPRGNTLIITIENSEISSPIFNWMIILWNFHLCWTSFFNHLNSQYNKINDKMLNRNLPFFQNEITDHWKSSGRTNHLLCLNISAVRIVISNQIVKKVAFLKKWLDFIHM